MGLKTIKFFTMMIRIIFLILVLTGTRSWAQEAPVEQAQLGDYEVRIEKDPDTGHAGVLKILKGGTLAYEEEGDTYSLKGEADFPKAGEDITGDQIPDLVISHFSGGAHCCFDTLIFSLGEQLILVQRLESGDSPVTFKDLNNDHIPELITYDHSFAYWHASFASSPAPQVILRFKDRDYTVDTELMKRPLEEIPPPEPNAEMHQAECESGNAWQQNDYCFSSENWGHMLDLMYAGHPQEAWKYLDAVWGSDEEGKQAFIKEFKKQLRKSPYRVLPPEEM